MDEHRIDPQQVIQSLQKFTATEISRLYTEIAGRDAFIDKLLSIVADLEDKLNGQG
jgi:hypothetical protein